MRKPRITPPAVAVLLLTSLSLALAACAMGPLEINLRENAERPASSQDQNVAQTVTAVLATNTAIAVLRTATANAPAALFETVPGQATQEAPPAPMPQEETPAVRLVYSPDTFTLLTGGRHAQDISGLSFHSPTGELSITSWDNGYLSASLYAFPPGDCLMAWGLNADYQEKPPGCDVRHAWIAVNNRQAFWQATGTFSVYWGGQPIAECASSAGACTITLP